MPTDGSLASCYGNQHFSQLKSFIGALKMSVIGRFRRSKNKQIHCSVALKQKAFVQVYREMMTKNRVRLLNPLCWLLTPIF